MFKYKIDVIEELKKKGISTYKIQKDKIIGSKTFMEIKHNKVVGIKSLDIICNLLECDIGDIIQHIPDTDTAVNDTDTAKQDPE